ncbi:MAG TPA: NlpC/P60 family protein [Trebonia sp.]
MSGVKRSVAIGAAVVLAGGIAAGAAQAAGAQPQPTVSQVQAEVNADTSKYDQISEQYDAAASQLSQANSRLAQVNKEMAADQQRYGSSRQKVVQIADASYEDQGQTSMAGLITNGNPSQVLDEASMIVEIAGQRNEEAQAFLDDAQQLTSAQQEQKRTQQGIAQVTAQRLKEKNEAQQALVNEKAQLDTLTQAEQQKVESETLGGGSTSSSGSSGSTTITAVTGTGDAAKAVAFDLEMAQDACPYVYGATGPCSAGFDCSGLQQAAWAAAGVNIPRDTYEQWAALPHVSMSDLQPGDLIYYDGEGHVAMYVGNGMIVDAPQTGQDVTERPMSTSWYADNEDGAVQP